MKVKVTLEAEVELNPEDYEYYEDALKDGEFYPFGAIKLDWEDDPDLLIQYLEIKSVEVIE